ncbi:MAG: LPS assembly protein LptD [Mariprofundaceae bacterium]
MRGGMARLACIAQLLAALFPIVADAARVEISADALSRDAYGQIVADGHVVIRRAQETLHADHVRYDPASNRMLATGHVRLESPRARLEAETAVLDTRSRAGELSEARITLPDGERLRALRVRRLESGVIMAESAYFSTCPADEESWRIAAARARLDAQAGELEARHARFEIRGLPVLYSPWWQQPLKRKSGLLIPSVATSRRVGTDWRLPIYLAPAVNWDATLTPRWMTARGLMGGLEWRHASRIGGERLAGEFIRDRKLNRPRGWIGGDIRWSLPHGFGFSAGGEHVGDHGYLADFADGEHATARYLQAEAALTQQWATGDWRLSAMHRQNLAAANDHATLQILPRLESRLRWPDDARGLPRLHLDQQTTRFMRRSGVHGWRMDLHPWLEWPLGGGGLRSRLWLGARHTRYWLQQSTGERMPRRTAVEAGFETAAEFERIGTSRRWRHVVSPRLRYDLVRAPLNQDRLPNFDSAFGNLTWNTLASGNRFSGRDRIERASRASLVLESRLQHKDAVDAPARDVFTLAFGASWDFHVWRVDPVLQQPRNGHLSNILGRAAIAPWRWLSLSGDAQYDPYRHFFATSRAALALHAGILRLAAAHQRTDPRFGTAVRLSSVDAGMDAARRWRLSGGWQYDHLRKRTQDARIALRYTHPCWTLGAEAFRRWQPGAVGEPANTGVALLLEFKGLGSVGS